MKRHLIHPPYRAIVMLGRPVRAEVYVLCFVAGYLLTICGCATDPRLQLASANRTLEAVQYRLIEEANAGRLEKKDVLLADVAVQAARALLDDSDARIAAGDTKAFRANMGAVNAILARLVQVYLPVPTTQPSAVRP